MIRNFWTHRIDEKDRIAKAEKKLKEKDFVPPIYKKIGDPDHPRYDNCVQPKKQPNWVVSGRAVNHVCCFTTKDTADAIHEASNIDDNLELERLALVLPPKYKASEQNGQYYLECVSDKDYWFDKIVVVIDFKKCKRECVDYFLGMFEKMKDPSEVHEIIGLCTLAIK